MSYGQDTIYLADFENQTGNNNWTLSTNASDGNWAIGTPSPYATNGVQMEIAAQNGSGALQTGINNNQDLDGGPVIATSPNITIPTGTTSLTLGYYFSHFSNSSADDFYSILLKSAATNQTLATLLLTQGTTSNRAAMWQTISSNLSPYSGQAVYLEIEAADISNGSKVEAALDQVVITNSGNQANVFLDENINGIQDSGEPGVPGVVISVYNDQGLVTQVTTDSEGNYDLSTLASGVKYRLEFDYSGTGYGLSVFGEDNKGDIRFATSDDLPVTLGLQESNLGCEENPFILIPCYVEGSLAQVSSEPALVKLREQDEGHDFNGVTYSNDYKASSIVNYGDVGTVYGVAWQSKYKKGYASAFHKRYAAFGPNGPDAIYQIDLDNGLLGVIELDALTGTSNSAGSDAHNFTPAGNGAIYDLGLSEASYDGVGKRSFGDIELSGDEKTLYVVNLWDRKIYALDVSSGIAANVTLLNSWNTPDPTNAGRNRPFGLAWHEDKLWLGSVDDNGLFAYVHSFIPSSGTYQLELTVPLNYTRQPYYGDADNTASPSDWNQWSTSTNFNFFNSNGEIAYPQAILSDIEFAMNGDMILGFRDRFGDQSGAHKFFNTNSTARTWAIAEGDILKACFGSGGYTLETGLTGACPVSGGAAGSGPGGTEFYYWDLFQIEDRIWNPNANDGAFHWETTQGGLLQMPNLPYVITTALDPYDDFSGGILKLNNQTGARHNTNPTSSATANLGGGYTIFEGGDYDTALPTGSAYSGKANGLGDIEAACSMDITIGNYVWFDLDMDGIQDPSESPLKNVLVSIYEDGTIIGSVSTDSLGMYFFGGPNNANLNSGITLGPATSYEIRINMTDAQSNDGSILNIAGVSTSDENNNNSDLIDSDATDNGTYASISFTISDSMYVDYSYDFGFIECEAVYSDNLYSGCANDGYTSTVGSSTYEVSSPSGVDTLVSSQGCDSIVTTNLSFLPIAEYDNEYDGCTGDGYTTSVGSNTYDEANPSGIDTLTSASGCDSIITTQLSFHPPASYFNTYAGCVNDGYSSTVGSSTYDENNPSGTDTLTTVYGCDSIVTTSLQFNPNSATSVDYYGVSGDGYMITVNGTVYDESNNSGTEIATNQHGCDSTITVDLFFAMPEVACNELIFDDFESGVGNWIDGGSDAFRINDATYASSGSFSFRLRDDTNTSVISTNSFDLTNIDSVSVNFNVYPRSLEGSEDLWFQISDDNGSSYTTVETWTNGVELTNDVPTSFQFTIGAPFTSQTRFRFRLDASANGDYVYLDDIRIDTCGATPIVCPIVSLQDSFICNQQIVFLDGNPSGGSGSYTSHSWADLGTGNTSGHVLTNISQQTVSLDLTAATSGSIDLEYSVTDSSGCTVMDTMQIIVLTTPLCEIETDLDTICTGVSATLSTVNHYAVTPFEGMVVSADSGPGLTQDHTIIGVQDPAHTKIVITLPTWDDHFDSTFLNGQLILPEIFETDSYNATGMNCATPWVANSNGLPRSIIEIQSGSVRYFSSLTPSSTEMTEVFPTNWTTIPRNVVEGDNILRFGVQNTAGPVSGSWTIEAFGNEGYTYLWSTGDTSESITISPTMSTTYSVTVTSPNGCTSSCSYDIVVQNITMTTEDVVLCKGSSIVTTSNISDATDPITHMWGPIDTVLAGVTLSGTTTDSLQITADANASGMMSIYHYVEDDKGCQARDTFELMIVPEIHDSIYVELCTGLSYQFGDSTITESGTYEKSDISQQGCDSTTIAEVFFTPAIRDTLLYSGCEGDGYSVTVNGNTYNESQPTGSETLTSNMGCDSILYIDLFFQDSIITNINYTGCSDDGYSVVVNGTTYDVNNPNGTEVAMSSSGCDSVIFVDLFYNPAAVVEAGMPANVLCSNGVLDLSTLGASISGGTTSGMWTTTGDGTFDNDGNFETSTTYTPGPFEIAAGEVILNLTSSNPPGSCEPEADAAMILINDLSCSQFPWVGN